SSRLLPPTEESDLFCPRADQRLTGHLDTARMLELSKDLLELGRETPAAFIAETRRDLGRKRRRGEPIVVECLGYRREPPLNWRYLDGDVAESGRFERGLENTWAAQPKRSRCTSRGFRHHPQAPQDGKWKRLKRVALRAPPDH